MSDAVISALGTVVAAFVGVLTWYLASRADRRREHLEREAARSAEEDQRAQRVLDIVVALHSEILAGIAANRRQLTAEEAAYALRQTSPFATADETDFVFESVQNDISILPAEVIHSVVQYYRIARQSNLLTKDLRDPYFLSQNNTEKRRFIGKLLHIVEIQKMWGETALSDLASYAARRGHDLDTNTTRADSLIARAHEQFGFIVTLSERSDPSLQPPARRGKSARKR